MAFLAESSSDTIIKFLFDEIATLRALVYLSSVVKILPIGEVIKLDNGLKDIEREIKANDTYYMLKNTKVPTIIVECGFLSNPEEAKKLSEKK
mgnify:CR=1 FL=1